MRDTMEAEDWVPELRVCRQPPGALPSDTRLHRLLVALLGIQVQVVVPLHAELWSDDHHQSLAQLQLTGVWAPTIVWLAAPPDRSLLAMGQDVASPPRDGHRGTAASPVDTHSPSGRGALRVPSGVCGAQVPGAPGQGAPLLLPRYGGNGAGGAPPSPVHPPQGAPWGPGPPGATQRGHRPPNVLVPKAQPGIWFHDLQALDTLRGTVVAVDAGAKRGGMAMAGVAQSGPGTYQGRVASGVGTLQEGEAMILLSYVRGLAQQLGVYWLVPDWEAAGGPPHVPRGGPLR